MQTKTCKSCGFTLLGDDDGPAVTDWLCDVCEKERTSAMTGAKTPHREPSPIPEISLEDLPSQTPIEAPLPESTPPTTPTGAECPHCFGLIRIPIEKYGKKVRCPLCQQGISVSATGELAPFDEFTEYLKQRAQDNVAGRERRKTGTYSPTGEAAPSEEEAAAEQDSSPIGLFILAVLPLFAGLVPYFVPEILPKVQSILAKVLPLLSG